MIQMDGGDRLRVTLLDRMSTVESGRSSLTTTTTGLTLEAILMADKNGITSPQQPETPSMNQSNHTHTLVDVMQREHHRHKTTAWKSLRDKLRLKRNATVWISSSNTPTPNHRDNDSHHHRLGFLLSNSRNSESDSEGRLRLGAVLAEERVLSAREEEETTPVTTTTMSEVQPARMSLMELLEENQGQMSLVVDGGGEEEEEDERVSCGGAVAAEISCCVCMVRSKGAAFIPCGHTFCRLCSRELWVQRGNCPLCNTSILEVLDLF